MEGRLRARPAGGHGRPSAAPAGLAAWTGASKQELGREFVESLARGLTVLTAFGEGRAELTLTEVAEATGLARATARRALITLEHLGYVSLARADLPRSPPAYWPSASRRCPARRCPQIAAPHLAELAGRVHDSASLAVLAGRRDPVHGARRHRPHHERQHHRRHPASRVRDLAWAASCSPACPRRPNGGSAGPACAPLTPHTVTGPGGSLRPSWTGTAGRLRAGRRGTGGGPALHRRPGPRPHGRGRGRGERRHAQRRGARRSSASRRCCLSCVRRRTRSRRTCGWRGGSPAYRRPEPDGAVGRTMK